MTGDSHSEAGASDSGMIMITLTYRKNKYEFHFDEDAATLAHLLDDIQDALDIPIANQKIIVPKAPLLRTTQPEEDLKVSLKPLQGKQLMLMGAPASEVRGVQEMSARIARRTAARQAQKAAAKLAPKAAKTKTKADQTSYTFLQVRPLQGLPHPEVSQKILLRLKNDPGIVATMQKHKFTVALLTEMEPLSHTQTTHEGTSRILGLNRNGGEVIELRLRTDAHDGYRDYKTIRKTLCHELTHNVHGDHDRVFWDLCHQIEREVDAADWKTGGQTIGESSRYQTNGQDEEEDDHQDDGGWQGGEFVLGGVRSNPTGLTRREVLANAAEERQKRDTEGEYKAECGWRPCQRQHRNDEAQ